MIFAAARMRFIFVTRCAGNKAIFSFGLIDIGGGILYLFKPCSSTIWPPISDPSLIASILKLKFLMDGLIKNYEPFT